MTLYLPLFLLALSTSVLAGLAYLVQRDRCANLEARIDQLTYDLDDATRERDRYRTSNAYLIQEAETMAVDLARTEQERSYLFACLQRRQRAKDHAAGWLLTSGWARAEKKADARMMEMQL